MKNLKEISKLITKQKIRKIEVFDEKYLDEGDGKFHQLFEGLQNNRFRNDREAAKQLYNCSPSEAKYRQLKSRFRRRLLNTLFFIDASKKVVSNYERANSACNKDWVLVNILLTYQAEEPAYQLARQTLTTAKKFQITNIILNCCRILKQEAAQNGDANAFDEYNNDFKKYNAIHNAEALSEELHQLVLVNYLRQSTANIDIEGACHELLKLDGDFKDSAIITYNLYLTWILRYEIEEQYQQMLEICDQAEKALADKNTLIIRDKQIIFHTKKMLAHLHLLDYQNGKISAEKCLNNYSKGSAVWFKFMEYYLLLALHTDQYIQSIAIFNEAFYLNSYKKLSRQEREKWSVYQAYLYYISHYLKSDIPILQKQQKKRFSVTAFINKVPDFSKEERVLTVLILILQTLFCLENKNYGGATERIERLKNLASRQLKKEGYDRTIQFIRLLRQLQRANYQPKQTMNTQKITDILTQKKFAYRGVIKDLEIIRYERLWTLLLDHLDKK